MPLDDVEVVILVEGDIQWLIEHPVPRSVAPGSVFASLAEHHQHFALRVQLPEHVPIRVGHPDIAVAVDAQRVRIDGDIRIEDAQHLTARRVVFDHFDLRVPIEDQQVALGCECDRSDVTELLPQRRYRTCTKVERQHRNTSRRSSRRGGRRDVGGIRSEVAGSWTGILAAYDSRQQQGQQQERRESFHDSKRIARCDGPGCGIFDPSDCSAASHGGGRSAPDRSRQVAE